MKRLVYSSKSYFSEKLIPGLVPSPCGDYCGEATHKRYKGIGIRDFRNGWMGDDSIDDVKHQLDELIEVFEMISLEVKNCRIRFFNVGANNDVSLHFYCDDRLCYISWPHTFVNSEIFMSYSASTSTTADLEVINSNNTEDVAEGFLSMRDNVLKSEQRSSISKDSKLKNDRLKIDTQMRADQFSSTELTVPIKIEEVIYHKQIWGDLPSESSLSESISDCININDANRFLKSIIVKLTDRGVYIQLKPKLRVSQLRVGGSALSVDAGLTLALKELSKKSNKYFDKIENQIN